MHTLKIYLNGGGWWVEDNDPTVKALFGSDTLPTAYTDVTPAAEVVAHLTRLNHDAQVTLL